MFGTSIGKAALAYFNTSGHEKEHLRNVLLKDLDKGTLVSPK